MESSHRDYAAKVENSSRDWYPDLKGWDRTENRKYYPESIVWKQVTSLDTLYQAFHTNKAPTDATNKRNVVNLQKNITYGSIGIPD